MYFLKSLAYIDMNLSLNKIILKNSSFPIGFTSTYANFRGQEASDIIREELEMQKPSLICKIGFTELNCILSCTNLVISNFSVVKLFLKVITDAKKKIAIKSGFFPNDKENIHRFSSLLLKDMQEIDILGSWLKHEKCISEYIKHAQKINVPDIEPFFHERPWTEALKNKKVLVIHPFETTIKFQYMKREKLFENMNVLPEFELITIRAIQSRENNSTDFESWWDAFAFLKSKIDEIEFDIAILGCGSYSLPLGAYIKRKGKKAIHMGGATQILFGIKGSRWEERENYKKLFNSSWVKPFPDDTPTNITKSDSYW